MKKMVYQFPPKEEEGIIIKNAELSIKLWKEKVYDKQKEVDPEPEHYWRSIALGFALGLGYEPKQAHEFVNIIDKKMLL